MRGEIETYIGDYLRCVDGSFSQYYKLCCTKSIPNSNHPQNGYIFVYVSNESNFDVFFDNLQVVDKPGAIVEENHYYPFGLTMAGISSKAAGGLINRKEYNGIEFNEDLDIDSYEAYYRNLDPQIGRWWQIDPKSEFLFGLSPYNSMVNNPTGITDPRGDIIKFDDNASGAYKAKVLLAAVTLLVKGVGGNLLQLATSERTYTFKETQGYGSTFTGDKKGTGGTVLWNPNI